MSVCESCGDQYEPSEDTIVTAGGWCAPNEIVAALPEQPAECSDCTARMAMMMAVGIDPGRHGENLRVPRGGIQYRRHP